MLNPPGPKPTIQHLPADVTHYHPGRGGDVVRWLILHNTEGSDSRLWLSRASIPRVSIHALIRPEARYNIVNYADTAYHVGYSLPGYRNSNALGVELESLNTGGQGRYPYSEGQYSMLAHLLATWLYSYGLDYDAAVRCHRDIAVYPPNWPEASMRGRLGRRHDPSGLDLARVRRDTLAWLAWFRQATDAERAAWII